MFLKLSVGIIISIILSSIVNLGLELCRSSKRVVGPFSGVVEAEEAPVLALTNWKEHGI